MKVDWSTQEMTKVHARWWEYMRDDENTCKLRDDERIRKRWILGYSWYDCHNPLFLSLWKLISKTVCVFVNEWFKTAVWHFVFQTSFWQKSSAKTWVLNTNWKDLNEKLEMTQAIRHRGKYYSPSIRVSQDWGKPGLSILINVYDLANDSCEELNS